MSHSLFHFESEHAEWTFEGGWQSAKTGEAMPAWEPFVVASTRAVTNPSSQRALMQLGFAIGFHFGMDFIVRVSTGGRSVYRSLSSLVFEALFNVRPVEALKHGAKAAAVPAAVVTFVTLGTWANHWTRESIQEETGGSGWNYTTPLTSGFGTVVV